jgi:hypothetical protein
MKAKETLIEPECDLAERTLVTYYHGLPLISIYRSAADFDVDLPHLNPPDTHIPSSNHYIRIDYHPHSGILRPEIIPLDGPPCQPPKISSNPVYYPPHKAWAPFSTRADFFFAYESVTRRESAPETSDRLKNIKTEYYTGGHCNITFDSYKDISNALENSRRFAISVSYFTPADLIDALTVCNANQFKTAKVSSKFQGEPIEYELRYREPMEWLRSIVKDESLRDNISYFPHRKYLYDIGSSDRLFDEPAASNAWWDAQVVYYLPFSFFIRA